MIMLGETIYIKNVITLTLTFVVYLKYLYVYIIR